MNLMLPVLLDREENGLLAHSFSIACYVEMNSAFAGSSTKQKPNTKNGECSSGKAYLVFDDEHRAPSRRPATSNNYGFMDHIEKQLDLHKSGSQMQKVMEVDYSLEKYEDLFTQQFGNLSTSCKVKRSKLSVGRRYSARFTVRWDYPGDCKKLFDTPAHEVSKTLKYGGKATPCTTSGNPELQNLEEEQETSSSKQEVKNSIQNPSHALPQGESTKCVLEEHFLNISLKEAMDQKEQISEGSNLQERTITCMEALLQLDAAAQNVLNLFTELGTLVSKEEISNGSGAKLYDEADKLLPSIAGKLNAVAKLVQCRNDSKFSSMVQVSGFEPRLETFAENLSERVM
ncbi:conserved hypothetical protein [Ricinus communis]|uniref:Uncharacterized protein n=1 Tax=Ricinus communis TaxID=3988 RepID=B9T8G3_RICCO|nr:conserved hypothetical protein [Ricinus communis]